GVVDTQIEGAFLGYGLQVGLSTLLERVLKVHIKKDQTYTHWDRRPLRREQLAYAAEDVLHLLPLHDRLRAELEARGRVEWAEEEMRALEDPERYTPVPPEERYQWVKGWQRLGGRGKTPPPGLAALLRAAVQAVAEREDIAPEVIASGREIEALASHGGQGEALDGLGVVRGWRRGLVGETLLAIARGELAIAYD